MDALPSIDGAMAATTIPEAKKVIHLLPRQQQCVRQQYPIIFSTQTVTHSPDNHIWKIKAAFSDRIEEVGRNCQFIRYPIDKSARKFPAQRTTSPIQMAIGSEENGAHLHSRAVHLFHWCWLRCVRESPQLRHFQSSGSSRNFSN